MGGQRRVGVDFDTLNSFSQEEIAEGVSYLLFKYIEKYGISQTKTEIDDDCRNKTGDYSLVGCNQKM